MTYGARLQFKRVFGWPGPREGLPIVPANLGACESSRECLLDLSKFKTKLILGFSKSPRRPEKGTNVKVLTFNCAPKEHDGGDEKKDEQQQRSLEPGD